MDERLIRAIAGNWLIEQTAQKQIVARLELVDWGAHMANWEKSKAAAGGMREIAKEANSPYPYEIKGGVALLDVDGVMLDRESSMADFMAETSNRRMQATVEAAAADPNAKAVLIRFDSPGGTIAGTGALARSVAAGNAVKPFHAYAGNLCCSAALWVATQCARFTCGAEAMVGSLGVRTELVDTSEAYAEIGIKIYPIASGDKKTVGADGQPVTEGDKQYTQDRVNALAEQFMAAVQSGRGLSDEQMAALSDGAVYVGAQARKMGLVDGIGSEADALAKLQRFDPSRQKPAPGGAKEKAHMTIQDIKNKVVAIFDGDDDTEPVTTKPAATAGATPPAVATDPLIGACKAHGIETPEQMHAMKATTDAVTADIRQQAKDSYLAVAPKAADGETDEQRTARETAHTGTLASIGKMDATAAIAARDGYRATAVRNECKTQAIRALGAEQGSAWASAIDQMDAASAAATRDRFRAQANAAFGITDTAGAPRQTAPVALSGTATSAEGDGGRITALLESTPLGKAAIENGKGGQ